MTSADQEDRPRVVRRLGRADEVQMHVHGDFLLQIDAGEVVVRRFGQRPAAEHHQIRVGLPLAEGVVGAYENNSPLAA